VSSPTQPPVGRRTGADAAQPPIDEARRAANALGASLAVTAAVGVVVTVVISSTSGISFAYRSPELHVAIETLVAVAYALAAALFFGRARRSAGLPDLLLLTALVMLAAAAGIFALGAAVSGHVGTSFATWAPATTRLLGGVCCSWPRSPRSGGWHGGRHTPPRRSSGAQPCWS
jgi:hypothetical protein